MGAVATIAASHRLCLGLCYLGCNEGVGWHCRHD